MSPSAQMSNADSSVHKVARSQVIGDVNFVDEFTCGLCKVNIIGCQPQLTKCSHVFCGDCLNHHFSSSAGNLHRNKRICPVCETLLHADSDIVPVEKNGLGSSGFLWRARNALHVKCGRLHAKGTCEWVGDYATYGIHIHQGSCCACEDAIVERNISDCATMSPSSSLSDMAAANEDELTSESDADVQTTPMTADVQELSSLVHALLQQKTKESQSTVSAADAPSADTTIARNGSGVHGNDPLPSMTTGKIDGIDNLCSLVEKLVCLREKEHMSKQQPGLCVSTESTIEPPPGLEENRSVTPRSPASSTLSLVESIDIEASPSLQCSPKRICLSEDLIEEPSPRARAVPASSCTSVAEPVIAAKQMEMIRWQQAAQAAQWQQASMAYAAHYQKMAMAYRAHAVCRRQAAMPQAAKRL